MITGVFVVVGLVAVPAKVGSFNECRNTRQPVLMILMFYQLDHVRCLIVFRVFKQDNASGRFDHNQLVSLWP